MEHAIWGGTWVLGRTTTSGPRLRSAAATAEYPQAAYAGLCRCFQAEWLYLQRVTDCDEALFQPLEDAISATFLPALLGETGPVADIVRRQAALPVKWGGMGIRNPVWTAEHNLYTSQFCTSALQASLRANTNLNVGDHRRKVRVGRELAEESTREMYDEILADLCHQGDSRRLNRVAATGSWLTVDPDEANGTTLTPEEFRDSARLRLGLTPLNLPSTCDGCMAPFTVDHGLSCKQGGLVTMRHNDVCHEWHGLCAAAFHPLAVTDEPLIHPGRNDGTVASEERGDVMVRGFWETGREAVFDVRITDADAPSQCQTSVEQLLRRHSKFKKDKYLRPCLEYRRHFTPLVFTVDGAMAPETAKAVRHLSERLASKWDAPRGFVTQYVRSRLAISLVRATTYCLRGSRAPGARMRLPRISNAAALQLYR